MDGSRIHGRSLGSQFHPSTSRAIPLDFSANTSRCFESSLPVPLKSPPDPQGTIRWPWEFPVVRGWTLTGCVQQQVCWLASLFPATGSGSTRMSSLAKHEALTIPADISPISLGNVLFLLSTHQALNRLTVRIQDRFVSFWQQPQKAIRFYLVLLILAHVFLSLGVGNSEIRDAFESGCESYRTTRIPFGIAGSGLILVHCANPCALNWYLSPVSSGQCSLVETFHSVGLS